MACTSWSRLLFIGRGLKCVNRKQGKAVFITVLSEVSLPVCSRCFSTTEVRRNTHVHGEVVVSYYRGLPAITVPLPSRREKCRFTLRPVSSTVGDFMRDLQNEDKGIDRIQVKTLDGVRIASSTTIESLIQDDFHLVVNDIIYHVVPPKEVRLTSEEVSSLHDVKAQVSRLYEVLHVDVHQLERERKLLAQLEELRVQLEPLEKKKNELMSHANKKTSVLTWLGLGLMGVQFGILARLTWWEYSWDIMEPVTYFITYGTTMAMYAYYVLTKQEYVLPSARDRQFLLTFHKQARKAGLDVEKYNFLKDSVHEIETELNRLRDPLRLNLPPRELEQRLQPSSLRQSTSTS